MATISVGAGRRRRSYAAAICYNGRKSDKDWFVRPDRSSPVCGTTSPGPATHARRSYGDDGGTIALRDYMLMGGRGGHAVTLSHTWRAATEMERTLHQAVPPPTGPMNATRWEPVDVNDASLRGAPRASH